MRNGELISGRYDPKSQFVKRWARFLKSQGLNKTAAQQLLLDEAMKARGY